MCPVNDFCGLSLIVEPVLAFCDLFFKLLMYVVTLKLSFAADWTAGYLQ